jgi:hypothetical protein
VQSPSSLGHMRRWAALPFCTTAEEQQEQQQPDQQQKKKTTTTSDGAAAADGKEEEEETSSGNKMQEGSADEKLGREVEAEEGEEAARAVRRAVRRLIGFADTKVRKRRFLSHLYIKCIILPRQARDKHRKNSQKVPFSRRRTRSSCGSARSTAAAECVV